jgi:ABC-type bacteriocin/lantibiotic exporter with double-glycine peptidase domain
MNDYYDVRLKEYRLKELESTDNVESSSVTGKTSNETTAGPIRFSDVSFRYAKGDHMVMEHFTHEFKPGSKTAIMGETGIGKTTLFRLLLGFIEPTSGHVDRNAAFCFVPQGNTLMSGTIRYNLQLAKPEATDQELKDVLHTACADFVNELPAGLDTELGERGSGLSEGQSQRIAIARGLLRPGTILLLDEISSALDESTERDLFERLFAAYPDRTFLLITHRTLVGELCDEIIHLS